MPSPVTVIGGTGRVGRLVVDRLLRHGAEVRVVSRHARRARDMAASGVTLYDGDIRTATDLAEPLDGAAGVMVSVEPGTAQSGPDRPAATMYEGVKNVLAACSPRTERFVLVSQIYVTRREHPINAWGGMLDWRLRGEDAIRAAGIPYTIIRPSWLTSGRTAGPAVRLEQGDQGDGKIAIDDVAEACLHAFLEPAAMGKTFEMYNGPGDKEVSWAALLTDLRAD